MNGLSGFAAKADEDIGGDIRMLGEAGEREVELLVVGAVVLHGAAGLVRDRHDAIDVRIALKQIGRPKALRNVLTGGSGTIDSANEGDVVACAVTAVAAVVAHEMALRGRAGGVISGMKGRRWAVAAKGVVALKNVGREIVNVDVSAGGNVLAGEANNLAVLANRLALGDGADGDLVAKADAAGDREDGSVELVFLTGLKRPRGDGDVVLRS